MSTAQDPTVVDEAPYFFLSYARTPRLQDDHGDPDKWVAKLYSDLCESVMQFTGGKWATVGFMEREERTGTHWPARLAQALACCRVFVPLYSPRYFESEECGKEWSAFTRRMASQAAKRNQPLIEAIVPALWEPVDPTLLPMAAKSIQFNHQSLGVLYSTEGFWGIMKVKRYKSDYQTAVQGLARRIVQVALQTALDPESPTDSLSLTSAFDDRVGNERARPDEQPTSDRSRRGDRPIRIMVAAPSTGNLPEGRQSSAYYGASAHEWNPYHPQSQAALAKYAAELTRMLGYRPVVVAFDEQPSAPTGESAQAPGLFLVDPWAAASDSRETRLREFDERAEDWISVLMPWNRADEETMAAEPTLRPQLTQALGNMLARTPSQHRMVANNIPTLGDFADILPPMAHVADKRFLNFANAYPPTGPMRPRPTLLRPRPMLYGPNPGPNPLAIEKERDPEEYDE